MVQNTMLCTALGTQKGYLVYHHCTSGLVYLIIAMLSKNSTRHESALRNFTHGSATMTDIHTGLMLRNKEC